MSLLVVSIYITLVSHLKLRTQLTLKIHSKLIFATPLWAYLQFLVISLSSSLIDLSCSYILGDSLRKRFVSNDSNDEIPIASQILATIYNFIGRLWYGYQVVGIENIPRTGPAIIVFYHGAVPVDHMFFWSKLVLMGRHIRTVGDHFIFKHRGFQNMLTLCYAPRQLGLCRISNLLSRFL